MWHDKTNHLNSWSTALDFTNNLTTNFGHVSAYRPLSYLTFSTAQAKVDCNFTVPQTAHLSTGFMSYLTQNRSLRRDVSLSQQPHSICTPDSGWGRSISLVMAALCNRAGHHIFALWFLSFFFFISFSSPNRSGHRLDVYHTSAPGVALVRI